MFETDFAFTNFYFFDKFNQMDVAEFVPVLEQKWSLDLQLCFFFHFFSHMLWWVSQGQKRCGAFHKTKDPNLLQRKNSA